MLFISNTFIFLIDGEHQLKSSVRVSMSQINFTHPRLDRITSYDLDSLTPDLDQATIDDLAFRLTGLSGDILELECIRLADAMLEDMHALGYALGRLEHLVVLALLRAAVAKIAWVQTGHA